MGGKGSKHERERREKEKERENIVSESETKSAVKQEQEKREENEGDVQAADLQAQSDRSAEGSSRFNNIDDLDSENTRDLVTGSDAAPPVSAGSGNESGADGTENTRTNENENICRSEGTEAQDADSAPQLAEKEVALAEAEIHEEGEAEENSDASASKVPISTSKEDQQLPPPTTARSDGPALLFWLVFLSAVSAVALTFIIFPDVSQGGASSLKMPGVVREHFSHGMLIKLPFSCVPGEDWINVFVRSEGNSNKETFLLLPGTGTSSFLFRAVLHGIASRGNFRAISFDFPGTGLSDKPASSDASCYSAREQARLLDALVAYLNLPSVHLVLHDTAGSVGALWAATRPSMVSSITFLDALTEPPHSPAFPSSALTHPLYRALLSVSASSTSPCCSSSALSSLPLRPFLFLLRSCCSKSMDLPTATAHLSLLAHGDRSLMASGIAVDRRVGNASDPKGILLAEELRGVAERGLGRTPKLLLWASEWEEAGEEMEAAWPFSKLLLHPGGRWMPEDHPDLLADHLLSFVASLPAHASVWHSTSDQQQEEFPEHVKQQFESMKASEGGGGGGCSHSHHGGGGHNHGEGGHAHGGGQYAHAGGVAQGHGVGHGGWVV